MAKGGVGTALRGSSNIVAVGALVGKAAVKGKGKVITMAKKGM